MIRLERVSKRYKKGSFFSKEYVEVLKDLSLEVRQSEHLGIIGESGAGKSTLCRILSFLELPTIGDIYLDGLKITKQNIKEKRGVVGMVFQDPATSLDPKMTIEETLKEAKKISENELIEWLAAVGLTDSVLKRKPNQLSGGQQQRVAIARTLLAGARYVIFDEFTSALDVSTQARIVNMLCDLNEKKHYSFIFVSHDVKLVGYLSDRIYVIYRGEIVEELKDIKHPKHPYSQALITNKIDDVNSYSYDNAGCSFYSACPYRMTKCKTNKPDLKEIDKDSKVRCFLYE